MHSGVAHKNHMKKEGLRLGCDALPSSAVRNQVMGVRSLNVGVIGAGPAGAAAAYELAKAGHHVQLFEASPFVGGMARSMTLWDQKTDLGPHRFFSSDARVNRLWLEVVGRDYRMVDRLTRIFYDGKFFLYPLQPTDALKNLGLLE